MTTTTPAVVTRYLDAAASFDFTGLAECFTRDGAVIDEGHTYKGRAEIIAWRKDLAGKWKFTNTITSTEAVSADEFRVSVHVEGDFPGGVADLTYRFTLSEGLITDLFIGE